MGKLKGGWLTRVLIDLPANTVLLYGDIGRGQSVFIIGVVRAAPKDGVTRLVVVSQDGQWIGLPLIKKCLPAQLTPARRSGDDLWPVPGIGMNGMVGMDMGLPKGLNRHVVRTVFHAGQLPGAGVSQTQMNRTRQRQAA